jgi:hypothetical protein
MMATAATRILRQQHRHIEQELALLEAQAGDCAGDFETVVVELTAHLAAEADVFYAAAEKALGQPLEEQRRQHGRVREAIVQAAEASSDTKSFARLLFDLTEAFKAHARVEERAIHPSLEGLLGQRQLEALGAKVAAFHSAVSRSLREGDGGATWLDRSTTRQNPCAPRDERRKSKITKA